MNLGMKKKNDPNENIPIISKYFTESSKNVNLFSVTNKISEDKLPFFVENPI